MAASTLDTAPSIWLSTHAAPYAKVRKLDPSSIVNTSSRRPVRGSSRSTVSYVVTHSDPSPYLSAFAAVGVRSRVISPDAVSMRRIRRSTGSTSTQATSPDAPRDDSTSGSAGSATRWTTSPEVSSTTSSTSGFRPTTQTRPPAASRAWTTADSTSTRWVTSPVDAS